MLDQSYFDKATTSASAVSHPADSGANRQDFSVPASVVLPGIESFTDAFDGTGKEFKKLAKRWKRETEYLSSPSEKYLNPNYARIIGLGRPAISLILRELQRAQDDWFYALRALTGENPVSASMAGDIVKMSDAWLKWGARHGHV